MLDIQDYGRCWACLFAMSKVDKGVVVKGGQWKRPF